MESNQIRGLDLSKIETPAFIVDLEALRENCRLLDALRKQTGVKVLLALKGFSMFSVFPEIREYLDGVCASSLNEAILGREEFGKEVHSYSPAYKKGTLEKLFELSDHIVFNTPGQWERFADLRNDYEGKVSCGLRINAEHSETETVIYDPSAPYSRLGSVRKEIPAGFIKQVDGVHIHNLCEKNFDSLRRTWRHVEKNFRTELAGLKWINLGGGHHITKPGYGYSELVQFLNDLKSKYRAQIYLEPGEAVALNAGYFVSEVLDIMKNDIDIAILDCAVPCHLPDVMEMPYRPQILSADGPYVKKYTYRLGGTSCLAGDVAGDYSFDRTLSPGDKLIFTDMAHYTMVKTTTFNGIGLPSIYACETEDNSLKLIKSFSYNDFKERLS